MGRTKHTKKQKFNFATKIKLLFFDPILKVRLSGEKQFQHSEDFQSGKRQLPLLHLRQMKEVTSNFAN